jgi:hypothetical protein
MIANRFQSITIGVRKYRQQTFSRFDPRHEQEQEGRDAPAK